MDKTDPDYEQKKQKFIECKRRIDDDCDSECDGCKFDLPLDDFVYFELYGTD